MSRTRGAVPDAARAAAESIVRKTQDIFHFNFIFKSWNFQNMSYNPHISNKEIIIVRKERRI